AKAARNAQVYQAPDDSITGVEETITDLGLITNHPADAVRLVRETEPNRTLVRRGLAGTRGVRALVDSRLCATFPHHSLVGDLRPPGPTVGGGLGVLARLLHPDAFR